jgi:methionine biosynthesis protein MetW
MKLESRLVVDFIEPLSKVLDVGCGDGNILLHLKKEKKIDARGIEIDHEKVKTSIAKGLSVVEGNAEKDLSNYPDQSFDYAILTQTLQAFYNPRKVLNELLRIGKNSIVSIPNFGYWKVRLSLLFNGRMPVTKTLPNTWYNTPNLHMCTIKDFFDLCVTDKIIIKKSIAVTGEKFSKITNSNLEFKNWSSEYGIFLISKNN